MEFVYFDFREVKNLYKVCFYGVILGQTYIGKIPQCNIITKSHYISPYDTKAFKSSIRHMGLDKINTWIQHIESHLKMIKDSKNDKIEIKYLDDFIQSIEISPIGSAILKYYISSRISGGLDYKEENYKELLSLEKYYTNILKLLNNNKIKREEHRE